MVNKNLKKIIFIAIVIVALIAIFDIIALNSGVFGSPEDYTQGNYTDGWWTVFFQYNILVIAMISIIYYFCISKDISESISVFILSVGLWFGGLTDVFYFWMQFEKVPETLPWLMNSPFISRVSTLLGETTVTSTTLFTSVIISGVLLFLLSKFLVEKF